MRRPIAWVMLLAGEAPIPSWRPGGRTLWLDLCASFCFLTRASEMFAETRWWIHESYCLRRADVALFRGDCQLTEALWSTADRVEVRFAGQRVISSERRLCACGRVFRGPWAPGGAPSIF